MITTAITPNSKFWITGLTVAIASACLSLSVASAQDTAAQEANDAAPAGESAIEQSAMASVEDASDQPDKVMDETVVVDPDDMADDLNSRQQLQQTFTLKRTINGEVVETEKRTVTFSRDEPYRETEAGRTTLDRIKSSFDGEALTRTEAFEEAKLDFVIADVDRNALMTAQEFAGLVHSWQNNEARKAAAPNDEIKRQRQYEAFLAEIDPQTAVKQNEAFALQKFAFMAGAAETMSLQDYVREYLLDFDAMDEDKNALLSGEELMKFRALNRGETLDM